MRRTTAWRAGVTLGVVGMALSIVGCGKSEPSRTSPSPQASQPQAATSAKAAAPPSSSATPTPSAEDVTVASEACKTGDVSRCDAACTAGKKDACLTLGQTRLKSDDDDVKASAIAPLKKACDGGFGRACSEVGGPALFAIRMKEIGALKLMKDKAKQMEIKEEQVRLTTKGCDLNDGLGCATLAGWYAEGYGVPKDASKASELAKKAVTLFEKECEAGDASSCAGLGYLYAGGKNGIAKDKSKALKLFKKGCDAKNELACNGLKELG